MKPLPMLRCFLLVVLLTASWSFSSGAVIAITIAPPILPVYPQPVCPAAGYLWTPGYWAYGPVGYYWVPGVWVQPPAVGLLWTPGYWGFANGFYGWHGGYWGPHIGFYGGVNYGFGYFGAGFVGGMWFGNHFRYNTAFMNVNTTFIHDTYVNRTGIVQGGMRTSFNGPGGLQSRPNTAELAAERDHHVERTEMQASHEHTASLDRSQRFSENHGRPSTPAFTRPGEAFHAGAPVRAGAAPSRAGGAPENRTGGAPNRGATPAVSHSEVPHPPPAAHTQGGGSTPQNGARPQSNARPQGGESTNHGGAPPSHNGAPPKSGGREGGNKGGEKERGRQ